MRKILIFTNVPGLTSMNDDLATRDDINEFRSTPIMMYIESQNKFMKVNDFTADGLYFISDDINYIYLENFKQLVGTSEKSSFYILKHNKPQFMLSGFKNVEKGHHGNKEDDGKLYPDIVNILQDSESNKVERIFKAVFKTNPILEAKINLVKEILNDRVPNQLDKPLTEFQYALEKFQNSKDEPFLSKEYKEAFELLLADLKMEN